MKLKPKTSPLIKLENLILDGGDICPPDAEGEEWLLIDRYDGDAGVGQSLTEACEQLSEEIYGS